MSVERISEEAFVTLYQGNIIPLRVCLAGLTLVIYDYFDTLEDEVRVIWTQRRGLGKFMFLWIRYYTIALVAFDVLQIHSFSLPGIASNTACVIIAPVTRILGVIGLWSVEIIMQMRIYALFNASRKVLLTNAVFFAASIGVYIWILTISSMRRGALIATAQRLPLPGCPAINGGTEWALWIPPTVFEFILFLFVAYKGLLSIAMRIKEKQQLTLTSVLINEHCLYFFSIFCLLIFNNLMVVVSTRIPWFGFAPFHAAMGIVTCRVFIDLRKFTLSNVDSKEKFTETIETAIFAHASQASLGTSGNLATDRGVVPLQSAKSGSDDGGSWPKTQRDPESLTPTRYVEALDQ